MPNTAEKLYYDGHCPICCREIKHLQKIKKDSLVLLDIHQQALTSAEKAAMLKELHLLNKEGEMMLGFEANLRAWQHTPYAPYIRIFHYPPLSWAGQLGYAIWLQFYRWRKHRYTSNSQR